MGVNKHLPHVLVLPEDDANRQIAIGFSLALEGQRRKQFQVLPVAKGWLKVKEQISSHALADIRVRNRQLVLLVDFDEDENRVEFIRQNTPDEIRDRVFILGAWKEPEQLRSAGLGNYEQIGGKLAEACHTDVKTASDWEHALLIHNEPELTRLRGSVRSILFG